MAAFPPLAQIVGRHMNIYEAYYLQADPRQTGSIGALDAAMFLKKSKIKDTVLSQVWDLSDPTGKGYLEKSGFFVALKLIALAQNGQDLNSSKLSLETPPPNLGAVEPVAVESLAQPAWDIQPSEKAKYDQVFESLGPVNNLLAGDKVRPVLMNSNLPVDVLGLIWDLGDIDKDGYLDKDEFSVAMHLVYRARENETTPTVLPPGLIPPSKRNKSANLPRADVAAPKNDVTSVAGKPWVVSSVEKSNADVMFLKLDTDMDGLVTGAEVRTILVQSGIPNQTLAHIWNLSDINGSGKLNPEQFALSMYLVQQKMKGVEPPSALTPEMIPPSLRPKGGADPAAFGVVDGTYAGPYTHVADFSSIKELDFISKEIDDIKRDKMQIERDKVQRDADIKIRQGEVQLLQKELDSMTSTLHQLETQKKEAQKCLDELGDKRSDLENNVKDIKEKCQEEQNEVDKLKGLINHQEKSAKENEEDLSQLRVDLNKLREEESSLEQQVDGGKQQLEALAKSQKQLQIEVSQIGSSPVSTLSGFSMGSATDEDPFKGKDPFNSSEPAPDPFQNDDPFKDDPFKPADGFQADPFAAGGADPFKESFGSSKTTSSKDDPFGAEDPFAGPFSSPSHNPQKQSNFDPFGSTPAIPEKQKNLGFGTDPFAPQTSKSSPSKAPSLPPKSNPKSKKMPPPRPAPPKAKSPLPTSATKPKVDPFGGFASDPFGGSDPFSSTTGSTTSNFAEFSPGKFEDSKSSAWGTSS